MTDTFEKALVVPLAIAMTVHQSLLVSRLAAGFKAD